MARWSLMCLAYFCLYKQALADVRLTGAGNQCLYCIDRVNGLIIQTSVMLYIHKKNIISLLQRFALSSNPKSHARHIWHQEEICNISA